MWLALAGTLHPASQIGVLLPYGLLDYSCNRYSVATIIIVLYVGGGGLFAFLGCGSQALASWFFHHIYKKMW